MYTWGFPVSISVSIQPPTPRWLWQLWNELTRKPAILHKTLSLRTRGSPLGPNASFIYSLTHTHTHPPRRGADASPTLGQIKARGWGGQPQYLQGNCAGGNCDCSRVHRSTWRAEAWERADLRRRGPRGPGQQRRRELRCRDQGPPTQATEAKTSGGWEPGLKVASTENWDAEAWGARYWSDGPPAPFCDRREGSVQAPGKARTSPARLRHIPIPLHPEPDHPPHQPCQAHLCSSWQQRKLHSKNLAATPRVGRRRVSGDNPPSPFYTQLSPASRQHWLVPDPGFRPIG